MNRFGCRGCRFNIGEFGWSSGIGNSDRRYFSCVGSQQAAITAAFLKTAIGQAKRNGLTGLSWYRWDDPTNDVPRYCGAWQGLVEADGSGKSVLKVFARFANRYGS